jgi:hypothetical protein
MVRSIRPTNYIKILFMKNKFICLILIFVNIAAGSFGQQEPNYDESKVPSYTLPEVLVSLQGRKISTSREWMEIRRPEVLSLFEEYIYGKIPGELTFYSAKIIEQDNNALEGRAVRKQVVLGFRKSGMEMELDVLMYLPKNVAKAPVFIGYNFYGNHTVRDDPEIPLTRSWIRNNPAAGIVDNLATEKGRGTGSRSWDIEKIIENGYGLVTMYYGDIDPDKDDFTDGVHPMFYKEGQERPLPDEWGSISAWAWGLSRVMDYLETDNDIDPERVIVMGHSRLGKTALWAGSLDQRFAIVISNNSGCGGAALSRRRYGERLGRMNQAFPHWLCGNSKQFDWNEDSLPVDQHMLISLIAPRPVYIASAEDDRWADPKGEYLSGYYASPVYELFGLKGLMEKEMPGLNSPVMNTIGYHIRSGRHAVLPYDWKQYIRFADMHFKSLTGKNTDLSGIYFSSDENRVTGEPGKGYKYGLNITAPWENGGILYLNFPEHLEYNPQGNGILRHSDKIASPWVISPDGLQATYKVESPDVKGVFVEAFARKATINEIPTGMSGVKLAMRISNNSKEALPVIRPLLCMQYSGLEGFPGAQQKNFEHNFIVLNDKPVSLADLKTSDPLTSFKGCVVKGCPQRDTRAENYGGLIEKDMDLAMSVVTSLDNRRNVIIWWTPGKSMIANANIPCIHADPYFGTLVPGDQGYAEGLIIFVDGDIRPAIDFLKNQERSVF